MRLSASQKQSSAVCLSKVGRPSQSAPFPENHKDTGRSRHGQHTEIPNLGFLCPKVWQLSPGALFLVTKGIGHIALRMAQGREKKHIHLDLYKYRYNFYQCFSSLNETRTPFREKQILTPAQC